MSYRIAFGMCLLVMGCDASGGARETVKSAEARITTQAVGLPRPSDPACGACRYSVYEQLVYLWLEGVKEMPTVDLVLYTPEKKVLGKYYGLAPKTTGSGSAVYPVAGGPTDNVGSGRLTWSLNGVPHSITIPAVYATALPIK